MPDVLPLVRPHWTDGLTCHRCHHHEPVTVIHDTQPHHLVLCQPCLTAILDEWIVQQASSAALIVGS